jgi:hypothetical protein
VNHHENTILAPIDLDIQTLRRVAMAYGSAQTAEHEISAAGAQDEHHPEVQVQMPAHHQSHESNYRHHGKHQYRDRKPDYPKDSRHF